MIVYFFYSYSLWLRRVAIPNQDLGSFAEEKKRVCIKFVRNNRVAGRATGSQKQKNQKPKTKNTKTVDAYGI